MEALTFSAYFQPPLVNYCIRDNDQYLKLNNSLANLTDRNETALDLSSTSFSCPRPGVAIQILKLIFDIIGKTISFSIPPDNLTQPQLWDWTTEALNRGTINGTANLFTLTTYTANDTAFTTPVLSYRRAFIIKTPNTRAVQLRLSFLGPFRSEIWIMLFFSSVFVALSMIFIGFVRQFHLADWKRKSYERSFVSRGFHSAWLIIRTSLSQGLGPHFDEQNAKLIGSPGRILLSTWFLSLLFVNILYTGTLITHLLFSLEKALPFRGLDTLAPLLKTGHYRWIIRSRNSDLFLQLNLSRGAIYEEVKMALQQYPPILEPDTQMFLRRLDHNPRLVGFSSTLEAPWLIGNRCNLTVIRDTYDNGQLLAFPFKKGSKLKTTLDFFLGQMREITYSTARKYSSDYEFSVKYCGDAGNRTRSIRLADVQDVVYTYLTICLGGILVLILELVRNYPKPQPGPQRRRDSKLE